MKNNKIIIISVFIFILLLSSVQVNALHSPGVNETHGAITFMVTNHHKNFALGGEFGLTNNLALHATYTAPFTRIGGKYQLRPGFALIGGVSNHHKPYLGLNGSAWINPDFDIIYEINFLFDHNIKFPYEIGGRLNLGYNLDLRFAFFGKIDDHMHFPNFKGGIGVGF